MCDDGQMGNKIRKLLGGVGAWVGCGILLSSCQLSSTSTTKAKGKDASSSSDSTNNNGGSGQVTPSAPTAADTTAPVLLEMVPASNAQQIGVETSIRLRFDEALDVQTALTRCAFSPTVIYTSAFDLATNTLVILPSQPLIAGNSYQLRCEGLKDAAGNTVNVDTTFTTRANRTDFQAPSTELSPEPAGATRTLEVTLGCVDEGTGCSRLYVSTDGSDPAATAAQVPPLRLTITSTTTLRFFAEDAEGNREAARSATYTIDNQAPNILAMVPSQGAQAVPVNGVLQVTFDEDMSPASLLNECQIAGVTLSPSYDATQRRLYLTPSGLRPGTRYQLSCNGTAVDLAGNALAASMSSSFVTELPPRQSLSMEAPLSINRHTLVTASNGDAVSFYAAGAFPALWAVRYNAASRGWSEPSKISDRVPMGATLDLLRGVTGIVEFGGRRVAYIEYYSNVPGAVGVYVASIDLDSGAQAVTLLASDATTSINRVGITQNNASQLTVFYHSAGTLRARNLNTSNFAFEPEVSATFAGVTVLSHCQLGKTQSQVLVVCRNGNTGTGGNKTEAHLASFNGSAFSLHGRIDAPSGAPTVGNMLLGANPAHDQAIFVVGVDNDVVVRLFDGTSWDPPLASPAFKANVDSADNLIGLVSPHVAIAGPNDFALAWRTNTTWQVRRYYQGAWQPVANTSVQSTGNGRICGTDSDDFVFVASVDPRGTDAQSERLMFDFLRSSSAALIPGGTLLAPLPADPLTSSVCLPSTNVLPALAYPSTAGVLIAEFTPATTDAALFALPTNGEAGAPRCAQNGARRMCAWPTPDGVQSVTRSTTGVFDTRQTGYVLAPLETVKPTPQFAVSSPTGAGALALNSPLGGQVFYVSPSGTLTSKTVAGLFNRDDGYFESVGFTPSGMVVPSWTDGNVSVQFDRVKNGAFSSGNISAYALGAGVDATERAVVMTHHPFLPSTTVVAYLDGSPIASPDMAGISLETLGSSKTGLSAQDEPMFFFFDINTALTHWTIYDNGNWTPHDVFTFPDTTTIPENYMVREIRRVGDRTLFIVSFVDESLASDLYYFTRESDGSFTPLTLFKSADGDLSGLRVLSGENTVAVFWASDLGEGTHLYGNVFNGTSWLGANDLGPQTPYLLAESVVLPIGDRFVVGWQDGGVVFVASASASLAQPAVELGPSTRAPALANDAGQLVVAFNSNGSLQVCREANQILTSLPSAAINFGTVAADTRVYGFGDQLVVDDGAWRRLDLRP